MILPKMQLTEINGVELEILDTGSGEPVIFVHAEFSGELNKIYLLRKYHKLGLGRQLVCNVANEFIKRGINSMLLFGDAINPSNKFYEQMGAEKLFAKNGEFHGGYGWTDLKKLVANCKNV